jgi:hypothetical protein
MRGLSTTASARSTPPKRQSSGAAIVVSHLQRGSSLCSEYSFCGGFSGVGLSKRNFFPAAIDMGDSSMGFRFSIHCGNVRFCSPPKSLSRSFLRLHSGACLPSPAPKTGIIDLASYRREYISTDGLELVGTGSQKWALLHSLRTGGSSKPSNRAGT